MIFILNEKVFVFMLKVLVLPLFIVFLSVFAFIGCGSVSSAPTATDMPNGEDTSLNTTNTDTSNTSSTTKLTVNDQTFSTVSSNELHINLSALVSNLDETKKYTFSIITPPSIGLVAINKDLLTYTPSIVGSDEIEYKVSDGSSDSNIGKITIDVTAASNSGGGASTLILLNNSITTTQDEVVTLNLSTLIKDFASASTYNFAVTTSSTIGTFTISGFTLTYTPNTGVVGNDQIFLRAGDGNSTSNIAQIDIQVQDPSTSTPHLQNVTYTIKPNVTIILDLNLLFLAPHPFPNKTYTFSINQQGKLGTGVITGSNLSYVPILNAIGTDTSMRILVQDDLGQKVETNITVVIAAN